MKLSTHALDLVCAKPMGTLLTLWLTGNRPSLRIFALSGILAVGDGTRCLVPKPRASATYAVDELSTRSYNEDSCEATYGRYFVEIRRKQGINAINRRFERRWVSGEGSGPGQRTFRDVTTNASIQPEALGREPHKQFEFQYTVVRIRCSRYCRLMMICRARRSRNRREGDQSRFPAHVTVCITYMTLA